MVDILKECIPIIVGALIAILPTMIEKKQEQENSKKEKEQQQKQNMYVELISLLGKVFKNQCEGEELDLLRNRINLISITGSVEVVKALNEYIDTWGEKNMEIQNEKYCNLLKEMRVDLGIDKKLNKKFPSIGFREIKVKK